MFSRMPNRILLLGLTVAVMAAVALVWTRFRYDVFPKRLVAVEEGFLYRSGQISARLIGGVIDDKGIDTVISLVGFDPERPDHVAEKAAIEQRGLRFVNVNLRGNGTGDPEDYVTALKAVHETREAGGQALVHCASGVRRAAGATALYRVLVQGEDPDRIFEEELDRFVGPLGLWGPRSATESQIVSYLNENMGKIAERLVAEGVISAVPAPTPQFSAR